MSDEIEVKGLTTENATFLLEAAEQLNLPPDVVKVSEGRFIVPADVADKAGFDENGNPKSRAAKKAAEEAEEAQMEEFKDTSNPTQADEAERAEAAQKRNEKAEAENEKPAAKKAAAKKAAAKSGE